MSGGGKTQTSTQQVAIPPEVLARYNSINARAEGVAGTPFQQYGGQFVAPVNAQQQLGIAGINNAANSAQPYFGAATGLTAAGAGAVNPGELQTQRYMNPYTENVVNATRRGLEQQQGQQASQQQADAIRGGAFGGDRAGIQRAVLQGQQGLATAQAIAPLYQQGYSQALQTGQQQQGVNLAANQANAARYLQAGQQFAGLGAQQQQSQLAGAQAQIGAGTLQQQTEQADTAARYQQFLQERGYPFQIAQFLANIGMGTGALSGSTTTTTQPGSFFSDEREKTNIKPLGEGQYAYDYIDDVERAERTGSPMPPKRVGPMAQDIERSDPGQVIDVNGYKVVNPTGESYSGGLAGGGYVDEPGAYDRGGYAPGGLVDPVDLRAILASQQQFLGPYAGQGGPYGGQKQGQPGFVPQASLPVPKLATAGNLSQPRPSGLSEAAQTGSQLAGLAKMGSDAFDKGREWLSSGKPQESAGPRVINQSGAVAAGLGAPRESADAAAGLSSAPVRVSDLVEATPILASRGGLMPQGYAMGGMPYGGDPTLQGVLDEGDQQIRQLPKPGQAPGAAKGLGSDLMDAAKLGSTAATAAAAAPEALAALMAFLPFSDQRLKHNIDPVGETYDGQQIYRYDMGDGRTQLGLMAQEVAQRKPDAVGNRNGFLTLDYDRATEDAVPRAYGGLVPRQGYQQGGYSDMPAENAQEAGLVTTFKVPAEYAPIIEQASRETGVPAAIIAATIKAESGFNPNTRGAAGERGVMQVRPSTARDPGFGLQPEAGDLRDPRVNVPFGARYLKARGEAAGVENWNDPAQAKKGLAGYNGRGQAADRYANNVLALVRDDGQPSASENAGLGAAAPNPPQVTAGLGAAAPYEGDRSPTRQGLSPRPGVLSETPENAPFRQIFGSMFGDSMKPETKRALTSENFWIPALTGIGSMLASRSPFLGPAIAEGLLGGTKAYTDLQKQQSDVETKKAGVENLGAQTVQTEQTTLQSSLQTLPNGMAIVWTADGKPVPLGDYNDLKKAGRAPPLLGRIPRNADQIIAKAFPDTAKPAVGVGAAPPPKQSEPAKTPGAVEPPKTPGAVEPPNASEPAKQTVLTPAGVYFDDTSQKVAKEERNTILNGGPGAQTLQAASKDYVEKVLASGTAARDTSRFLTELAENLGTAAQGQGLNVAGFGFKGRAEIINALNTFSRAFGGPQFGAADEVKQINDKITALQAAAATKSVGQESYAALSMMEKAIAGPAMTPRAFSKLSGDLLAQNQRMIDRYNHYELYTKSSEVGAGKAQGDFSRLHNDAKYTKEAEAISNMVLRAPDLIKAFRSGQYSPGEIDTAFKSAYGLDGMSRYFIGGR